MSTNTAVLSCKDLSVGYKDSTILSNINLDFEPSQFISLLGPNGAGKTTLLRTLSRHLKPVSGSVLIGGRPLDSMRQDELAKIMAIVLTDKVTPPLFSASEFVALGRYPHTNFLGRMSQEDKDVVIQALIAVNAENLSNREFTSLSDGEKQKVLVARALAQEPKILLLDEPTAHLDLKHRVEVMSILRDLCATKNITVIASLHDVDIAAKVSDKVALIKNGAVTGWGAPEEVLSSKDVAELYDFNSACFNSQLGSIELRGKNNRAKVFVVGGMGSGAQVFRILAKSGYQISTGVLYENDLDCYVAESLGCTCSSQTPSDTIKETSLKSAMSEMDNCDWVIDTGFDSSGVYHNNLQLLAGASQKGKPIISLGTRDTQLFEGNNPAQFTVLQKASEIPTILERN